jgi:O-antigen/teichoic acid export membrane protein
MSNIRTLYRQSASYLFGLAGVTLLGFISFPLFTRILPVAEYGVLNLVTKTLLMVVVISKLGIQHSVVRFYEECRASSDPLAVVRYYSTLYWASGGLAILCALLFAAAIWAAPQTWISALVRKPMLGAAALVFTSTMTSLLMSFFRAAGQTRTYAWVQIGMKAATVILVTILLFRWERTARAFVAGSTVAELGCVVLLSVPLLRTGRVRLACFDAGFVKQTLVFGLPLLLFELSYMLHDSGARILIQAYLGAVPLGYYSAAYNVAAYCQDLILAPLNLALFPMFVKLWTNQGKAATQEFLRHVLKDILLIGFLVVAGAVVCAREAMILLASRKYEPSAELLPILVAGLMTYTVVPVFYAGLYLEKRTWTMARVVFGACLVNLALNLVLLPRLGIRGAVYAALASYGTLLVSAAHSSLKILPIDIPWASCGRYLLAGAIAVAAAAPLQCPYPVVSIAIKGLVALSVYVAVLWPLDAHLRERLKTCYREGRSLLA